MYEIGVDYFMRNINSITYEEANLYFRYCDKTGNLYWKNHPLERYNGKIAGWRSNPTTGKAVRVNNKPVRQHGIVWLLKTGRWPIYGLRHINGDRFDNRFQNLQERISLGKPKNSFDRNARRSNKSGTTGVCRYKEKWMAYIRREKLGIFEEYDDAVRARKEAEKSDKTFCSPSHKH